MRSAVGKRLLFIALLGGALLTPLGTIVNAESANGSDNGQDIENEALLNELMSQGEAAYTETCAECHGPQGGGQVGPPLRQNVANAEGIIRAIVGGRGNMPPVAWDFSDRELAAVATYIRNSWGNEYGLVSERQAQDFRP